MDLDVAPISSEVGLQQFFDLESSGIRPADPDPYFDLLVDGKREWGIRSKTILDLRYTREWPGWFCLEQDFAEDPEGLRQIELSLGRTQADKDCDHIQIEALNARLLL